MKLGIIGAGNVGEVVAYTAAIRGLANEILFYDIDSKKANSQAMDLNDGRLFYPHDVKAYGARAIELAECDICVVCSGLIPETGDRLDELSLNKDAVKKYITEICEAGFDGFFVCVTNPCDVISYQVYKSSNLPANRIIGSGTALDSARLNVVVADALGISPKSVYGNVLGEHGESQFVPWSQVRIGNESIKRYREKNPELFYGFDPVEIEDEVRRRGWEIYMGKKATQGGIGNTVNDIISAIVNDEKKILNASALLEGQYGLEDIFISTPIMIGADGVEEIIELDLTEEELKRYKNAASIIKKHIGYL